MKVTGVKRLMKQLSDLPKEVQAGLEKSIDRTVNLGVSKAKALAPSVTGDFKNGINGHIEKKSDGAIFGFINLYEGDFYEALAAATINYGWNNMPVAYHVRAQVKAIIGPRSKRSVQRQIKKALRETVNG